MKFPGSSCLSVTLSLLSSGAAPPPHRPGVVLTERTQSLSSKPPFLSSYLTNLPADACALPFWSRHWHLQDGFLGMLFSASSTGSSSYTSRCASSSRASTTVGAERYGAVIGVMSASLHRPHTHKGQACWAAHHRDLWA